MIPILYTTYNRLEYTKRTLPALLKNSNGVKVYVYDNDSTDGTQEYLDIISRHERIKDIHFCCKNFGISTIMNLFFEETKDFPIIGKVDNDTLVPSNWIEDLGGVLQNYHLGIVQAKHKFWIKGVKDWDDLVARSSNVIKLQDGKYNLIPSQVVGGSGILIRTAILEKLQGNLNIWGWSKFQLENPQYRYAFYDGVEVELLDMADYNRHASGGDDYRQEIGRPTLRG